MTNIWEIKDQFRRGLFDEALKNITNLSKVQKVYGEILKAEIFEKQGKLVDALNIINAIYYEIDVKNVNLLFLAEVMRAGIVYKLGDYSKTKKCLLSASSIYSKLPNNSDNEISEIFANFKRIYGNLYFSQGLFEQSLTSFQESLEIFQQLEIQADIAMIFHDMGQIEGFKGNYEIALGYYDSAFLIQQKLKHKTNMAICLNKLISTHLELNNERKWEDHLESLRILSQQSEDDFIPLLYKFSKAIIYKNNSRFAIKFKSQELFKDIIDDKIIDHNLTMLAMLRYSELLLDELKLMVDDDISKDISIDLQDISRSISNIAYSLNSIPLIIELLIIEARFASINGNLDMALNILNQGLETVKEKNLKFLIIRLSDCNKQINEEYNHWLQKFEFINHPRYELEILDISDYLESVKRMMDVKGIN